MEPETTKKELSEKLGLEPETVSDFPDEKLFRPLVYSSDFGCDFDNLYLPILKKDGYLFFLASSRVGIGSDTYLEVKNVTSDYFDSFVDAFPLMRNCLEIQEQTGVPFHVDKLNKAILWLIKNYRNLVEKEQLPLEQAVELVSELYIYGDPRFQDSQSPMSQTIRGFIIQDLDTEEKPVSVKDTILEILKS